MCVCGCVYRERGRGLPLFSVLPPPRIWRKDALFNTIKPSFTTIKTSLIISVATELSHDESDTEIAVTLPTEVSLYYILIYLCIYIYIYIYIYICVCVCVCV